MDVEALGAALFGLVIGWVTYRTLRRSEDKVALADIASVIAAVGGAAVVGLFDEGELFAWYSIGLAAGFFGYLVVGYLRDRVRPEPAEAPAADGSATPGKAFDDWMMPGGRRRQRGTEPPAQRQT